MRELHAWMGDSPVGVFLEDSEGNVPLEYAKGVDRPISLSLPLDGKAAYAHRRRHRCQGCDAPSLGEAGIGKQPRSRAGRRPGQENGRSGPLQHRGGVFGCGASYP